MALQRLKEAEERIAKLEAGIQRLKAIRKRPFQASFPLGSEGTAAHPERKRERKQAMNKMYEEQ